MTRTEKLLAEIIALPSVNPAFLPANDFRAGEKKVADYLAVMAAPAGLEVDFQEVQAGRSNVIVRYSPLGRVQRRVLLAPHLDTVVACDAQFLPFRKAGRLHGRGACDTKGSVAAMLMALCEVAGGKKRPKSTEIIFAGLVDEENAQAGSRKLAASGIKADLAIVGEPTRLQVVTAHKGSLWLDLETRGRAAHGSTPHLGKNAVLEMARVVEFLEGDYAGQLRQRTHPVLGRPTVNVGVISGGRQPNIVPDQCMIRVDRRTLPGETEAAVRRELKTQLQARGLSINIVGGKMVPCPALETDHRLPMVQQFLKKTGQSHPMGVDYFCDAAVLAAAGIPSVVFGPGDIAQAHTADEWIALDSLERGKDLLRDFLKSLP